MATPTADDLLDEIRQLARELDTTPTATDMNQSGEYWASKYQEEFGGWNDAVREAGLEPNQPWKIPTDDLLNEIRRLARELNKTPTKKQMNERGEYYGQSYQKRFGSWSEGVRQAGLEPNKRITESEFRDRPDTCRLCDHVPTDELDFHHWRYGENKAGCYLCRDCHDQVHADGARPEENPGWLMKAVENLIRYHVNHYEETTANSIASRYNIPSKGLVETVMSDLDI